MIEVKNIENKITKLNIENKEYCSFLDELIVKYPYATFLQLLRLKSLDILDKSKLDEETERIYKLFPQRNYIHLKSQQEKIQPISSHNNIKVASIETDLSKEMSTLNLEKKPFTLENVKVTEIEPSSFQLKSIHLEQNEDSKIKQFINGINKEDIPFVLETLINQYYKDNPLGQINFTPKEEDSIIEEHTTIDLNKKMSFKEWANLSNKIQNNSLKENKATSQNFIIEKFLKENPKITKPSNDFQELEIQYNSPEYYSIMTETLVEIYLDQNKYEKAIEGYKILSLKFPEKNLYFADKINQILKLI